MASIEEKVEEHYKKILDELGIRHYGKTESINRTITDALRSADSKSGGSGNNYPDWKRSRSPGRSSLSPIMRKTVSARTVRYSITLATPIIPAL